MADRSSPSPARRPQLNERHSSGQSISRASPSGLTSTSHKGSSQRLHKTHAVGHHGRYPHGKVPSYGKNLQRLSKQSATHHEEVLPKQHTRNKSSELLDSLTAQDVRRNSSNVNLPRTGSKVSMKKSASGIALQHRNGSATKLGKGGHAEKSQHSHLEKNRSAQGQSKAKPKFSVGSYGQDDDWTEESPSPRMTRQNSEPYQPPQPAELPQSPDDPPRRSPTDLPHSPPQSPPAQRTDFADKHPPPTQQEPTQTSPFPDADGLTSRLLRKYNAAPHLSSVSATVTPIGSNASPAFHHGTNNNCPPSNPTEPSLPSDGISRFLNPAGSSGSGSTTSNSISHLQSTLAALHREQHRKPHSPTTSSPPSKLEAARRARSAANLTHPQLGISSPHSVSPPPSRARNGTGARASPFESAAPKAPSKSLTQLKLDLQRVSSGREDSQKRSAPSSLLHGSHSLLNVNISVGAENEKERRERQHAQACRELRNAQRFDNVILKAVGRLERKGLVERKREGKGDGERREGKEGKVGSLARSAGEGSRPPSRGRVRFEIGRNDGDDDDDDEEGGERALLRRMWEGDGVGND